MALVVVMALAAVGMEEAVIGAALGGIALAVVGMTVVVIGTAAGTAEVGNIMIITVAGGELVPR
jgi:hypothetical protein